MTMGTYPTMVEKQKFGRAAAATKSIVSAAALAARGPSTRGKVRGSYDDTGATRGGRRWLRRRRRSLRARLCGGTGGWGRGVDDEAAYRAASAAAMVKVEEGS